MRMIYYLRFWSINSKKVIIKLKEKKYKNWQWRNKQIFELEHPQSCPFKITLEYELIIYWFIITKCLIVFEKTYCPFTSYQGLYHE